VRRLLEADILSEACRFPGDTRERLAKFGLDYSRMRLAIEVGRFAETN